MWSQLRPVARHMRLVDCHTFLAYLSHFYVPTEPLWPLFCRCGPPGLRLRTDAKKSHQASQSIGLRIHGGTRCGGLAAAGSVGLGHLVQLPRRLSAWHVLSGLHLARCSNLRHNITDLLDALDDLLQGLTRGI